MGDKLKLSAYRCSVWKHCHLKYDYIYNQHIVPKTKSKPLMVGDIVHQLQQLYYTGKLTPELIMNLEDFVKEQYQNDEDETILEVALEAGRLMKGYIETYHNKDPLTFISHETILQHDMGEFILHARVDALARPQEKQHKGLWRVETKTAGRLDAAYLNGLKRGLQGSIYDFLVEKVMEERIAGTIHNLLVKTKVPGYHRTYTSRSQTAIDRMLQTVKGIAREIERYDIFPSSDCFTYNRECEYKLLCEHDTPVVRQSFYTTRPPKDDSEDDGTSEVTE